MSKQLSVKIPFSGFYESAHKELSDLASINEALQREMAQPKPNEGLSMSKHTPGPWGRNIKPARKYTTIYGREAPNHTHVCHLSVSGLDDAEIEANCNLIAAAPDLLKALVQIREHLAHNDNARTIMLTLADAAIAKAVQS